MIRCCTNKDFEAIEAVINDGAEAYRGSIPADCWHEPYMTASALVEEIEAGVDFWGWDEAHTLTGVMGIQQVQDVTLIRHAYVRTAHQRRGIGAQLLSHLRKLANSPLLI